MFEALWPELERKASAIPKQATQQKQARAQVEVLEELVGAVRTMESRLRDGSEDSRPRRRNRIHPMMFHEMGHMLSERPGDPINILLGCSIFRDDAPWLYELGMEAYRAVSAGKPEAGRRALNRFLKAVDFSRRGPFGPEEFGWDSKMHHMMFRELEFMLHRDGGLLEEKVPEHKGKGKALDQ